MIYSRRAGEETFNIHVPEMPERYDVMNTLLHNEYMDVTQRSETIRNIYYRYGDIEEIMDDVFPKKH